ncbi:TadE/TadG family type IV pilus assembly protein [Pseudogemmobacter humi]|uniref:TadE-like protein n=1 Tax=Pseudogemmobacter humi TaxID=2483812 RepID=A0A3P5XE95_9RHOB|nr:hypothetical protein [Pseudogemmobacter humi]VDC28588.1 hypothetical protein XINFAN_02166 [Pseudogemmobacter humi]
MLSWTRGHLRRFGKEEDGLVMTEFLILLPLLVWSFMALVIYWDAYRTVNGAQKASYAIADLISRQSRIDRPFILGMEGVMESLLGRPNVVSMRITSLQYTEDKNGVGKFTVLFSESPNSRKPKLTTTAVQGLADRIPMMTSGDTTVLVETWTNYQPGFEVGIPFSTFENFIVTRPRYHRRVCLTEEMKKSCPDNA